MGHSPWTTPLHGYAPFGIPPSVSDPSLVWTAPEEEEYVASDQKLQPREKKPYQRGLTTLPSQKTWPFRDVVLVPASKRYMLILAFHYRNFIIVDFFITYILISAFHCVARSSMATRAGSRHVATRTSLETSLESIFLGLSISLVVASM